MATKICLVSVLAVTVSRSSAQPWEYDAQSWNYSPDWADDSGSDSRRPITWTTAADA
eukprot:SAG31_NODE_26539_length_440_cov_1.237537_1_plen_56_part_10